MRRENFYRRDPLAALNGMIGLTLEEKAVYNTVIDLLYSTWRPVEDNRQFIANWCGCAVQRLNPILSKLIEKGKLVRIQQGPLWYLTNDRFEAERTAVKGPKKAAEKRSDRGEVGEKSGEVGQNPLLLEVDTTENQSVTALEKTREEKKEPPVVPQGGKQTVQLELVPEEPSEQVDEVALAFEAYNHAAQRLSLTKARDLTPARRRSIRKRLDAGGLDSWKEALDAVAKSAFLRGQRPGKDGRGFRIDIDFLCQAKSFQRLREGFYGEDAIEPAAPLAANPHGPWRARMLDWTHNRYWNALDWGPKPGQDGCQVPPELLASVRADVLPFEPRAA